MINQNATTAYTWRTTKSPVGILTTETFVIIVLNPSNKKTLSSSTSTTPLIHIISTIQKVPVTLKLPLMLQFLHLKSVNMPFE